MLLLAVQLDRVFLPLKQFSSLQIQRQEALRGGELRIQATGKQNQVIYLNSELDYRDQRNISIAIPPKVSVNFKQLYGSAPDVFFKGKKITVSGEAKRGKIWFFSDGKRSDKYYYQTHVNVTSIKQIKVL